MPPNDKAGRVVFIGNIPYGGTEEMIVETLGRVGQVLNFRLVYDKETGRPKGFGFAEFADADAAASAVRNLNDYEIMGRKLRVDWSNDNGSGDSAPANYTAPTAPPNGQQETIAPLQQPTALPPLPPGVDVPPNLTAPDAISRTLSTLPPPQLLDILSQMKQLVVNEPNKATELLRQAPQLSYAIFQALLILGLVDQTLVGQLIETTAPTPSVAPPVQPPAPQPPRPNYGAYPPQPAPTPPVQVHHPPPQQQQYQPQPAAPQFNLSQLPPEQAAQYAPILNLTPSQMEGLPADQKAQVMQIRALFGLR
ncbi:hinge domain of cleavage stimulation factor subunit 2-domain-containing protein [Dendryphion nanum]|uniref:Hinge domain of cleavage stimulation factor subunit 2-domain-containing protein n=1 Tax=Dendryphion nanum TaxID=256645 RepID=A0A9P9DGT0_9PLEO|nr:hinge domain of cleavage stimulation factor subunit 2-domain-containing protein [Dendryphion nanum]